MAKKKKKKGFFPLGNQVVSTGQESTWQVLSGSGRGRQLIAAINVQVVRSCLNCETLTSH